MFHSCKNKQYTILDWDIINICSNNKEIKQICQGVKKKGEKCTKEGYYFKNDLCITVPSKLNKE